MWRVVDVMLIGGLAALTRPFGVLLLLPLVWEWWRWRGAADQPEVRRLRTVSGLWTLLVPAAIAGYLFFSRAVFGDPLALLHRQERWRGGLSGPWRAWTRAPSPHGRVHGVSRADRYRRGNTETEARAAQ